MLPLRFKNKTRPHREFDLNLISSFFRDSQPLKQKLQEEGFQGVEVVNTAIECPSNMTLSRPAMLIDASVLLRVGRCILLLHVTNYDEYHCTGCVRSSQVIGNSCGLDA